jgi:hypothetical protein
MDVHAIRADLAARLVALGWEATAFVPESYSSYPCAVVNPPSVVEGFTAGLGQARLELPITIAVSLDSFEDAQGRLDAEMSTSNPDSLVVKLAALGMGDNWTKVHVLTAGAVRFSDDGDARVMAADITVEVFARK